MLKNKQLSKIKIKNRLIPHKTNMLINNNNIFIKKHYYLLQLWTNEKSNQFV